MILSKSKWNLFYPISTIQSEKRKEKRSKHIIIKLYISFFMLVYKFPQV